MPDSFSFLVTAEQHQTIHEWWDKVKALYFEPDDDCFQYPGSIEYRFTPTGIGSIFIVGDSYSGEELDLTEMDKW